MMTLLYWLDALFLVTLVAAFSLMVHLARAADKRAAETERPTKGWTRIEI